MKSKVKKPMLFASTTKIMTALLALELYDLEEEVKIKREWTGIEGSSIYLVPNEIVTIKELVYGLLLNSGNDAAVALSSIYSKNLENFVTLMNVRALEIGAYNTFFENSNGLDGENHKTTAKDLAMITAEAMKNPDFCKIVATKEIKIGKRYFTNHNKLLRMSQDVVGVKTGFTKKAGRCLVSAVEKGGRVYIVVTLNAPNDWNDHLKLYDTYCKTGEKQKIIGEDFEIEIPLVSAVKSIVSIKPSETVELSLLQNEKIGIKIMGSRFIYGGVTKGEKYGEMLLYLGDKPVKKIDLMYKETVETQKIKRNFIINIWEILKNFKK